MTIVTIGLDLAKHAFQVHGVDEIGRVVAVLKGSVGPSRSFRPRSIVLRASPVTAETATKPPYPAARTSAAANSRRPRSPK